MNYRKILVILGSILLAVGTALAAFALYSVHVLERDKNRVQTEEARKRRWAKEREEGKEPDPETVKQEQQPLIAKIIRVKKEAVKKSEPGEEKELFDAAEEESKKEVAELNNEPE